MPDESKKVWWAAAAKDGWGKGWSVMSEAGDAGLRVMVLGTGASAPGWPEHLMQKLEQEVGDEISQFVRPVVVDIGPDSKTMRLTLEQLGQDGQVLERRQALISYSEDEHIRPTLAQLES